MSETNNEVYEVIEDIEVELSSTIYAMENKCLELIPRDICAVFSRHGFKAEERVYITETTKLLLSGALVEFERSPQEHSAKEKQELVDLITSISRLMRALMKPVRKRIPKLSPRYYDITADYLDKMAADLSQIMLPNVGKNNGTPKK